MLKTILVPLDGSALAEAALGYAVQLSIPTGGKLLLVRAAHSHTMPGVDPRERKEGAIFEAEEYLTRTAARLIERGYACEAVVPYGQAAECIVEQARMSDTNLIVMSTHGRTGPGHLLFGSVAEGVVSRSSVPVLVTRAWLPAEPDGLLKDKPLLLVPLDGSSFAEAALQPAVELAEDLGAGLLLVSAQPGESPPMAALEYLTSVEARLHKAHPDVGLDVDARYASPTQAIDDAFRESGASLVIMATHGRSGVVRSVMGSVAGKVVKEGHAPVVLIRPPVATEEIAENAGRSPVGSAG
jgi:nucleotide-binding universal stress UspA family protein